MELPLVKTWKLARRANKNLVVGEDCSIETANLDLRFGGGKIIIHNHVIINKEVQIIRVSHHIDDNTEFSTRYFPDLHIGSYSWIATGTKILPQVTNIAEGCVCVELFRLLQEIVNKMESMWEILQGWCASIIQDSRIL